MHLPPPARGTASLDRVPGLTMPGTWTGLRYMRLLATLLAIGAGCTRDDGAGLAPIEVDPPASAASAPSTDRSSRVAELASGPDPTLIDPCALVWQEEAEAIVQLSLNSPEAFNLGSGRPSCVYGGFPSGPVAKVDVMVGEGAQALVSTDRRLNEADPDAFEALDDLGDEAWLRNSTVYFRRGETWVVVGAVRLIDKGLLRNPLIAAAQAADARLLAGEAERSP